MRPNAEFRQALSADDVWTLIVPVWATGFAEQAPDEMVAAHNAPPPPGGATAGMVRSVKDGNLRVQ
jgi:hypothetical protein